MIKILITGGNGFIGRNLTEQLSMKYDVSSPGRSVLDILNQDAVETYLRSHNFDIVIHAANQNSTRRKGTTDYEVLHNNIKMFCNLQRCNNLYDRMYYFGSGAEYDSRYYKPNMKEEYFEEHIPEDAYGFSKFVIHKLSKQTSNIYNLILFGVYGKYEEWDRRFISNAICRNICNRSIEIKKNAFLDYLYIDDLCNIMEWFVENVPKRSCYNICRGEKINLETLAELINSVSESPSEIKICKQGYRLEYSGDNSRMIDEISEKNLEFTEYRTSVHKLMEYYKEHKKDLGIINKGDKSGI